jgi:hypothetical protein
MLNEMLHHVGGSLTLFIFVRVSQLDALPPP